MIMLDYRAIITKIDKLEKLSKSDNPDEKKISKKIHELSRTISESKVVLNPEQLSDIQKRIGLLHQLTSNPRIKDRINSLTKSA